MEMVAVVVVKMVAVAVMVVEMVAVVTVWKISSVIDNFIQITKIEKQKRFNPLPQPSVWEDFNIPGGVH